MTAQDLVAPLVEPWASRLMDVIIGAAMLVFFAPLILLLALAVKLDSPGPAIFRHRRIGRGGQAFFCLKLRSMTADADARLKAHLEQNPDARAEWEATQKLKDDPRITPLGAFLRKSSLDELPQILNILRGEMALVGPRPIVAVEARFYGPHFESYKAVRPGLTGLWQISGRNDTSYEERVALDVAYVRQRSFLVDLRILIATIPTVLLRRGSY